MSKILIVEDNEMNRDMLSRRLMRKGFEIVMAEDGQKGCRYVKIRKSRPYLNGSKSSCDGWLGGNINHKGLILKQIQFLLLFLQHMRWQVIEKKHLQLVPMSMIQNL